MQQRSDGTREEASQQTYATPQQPAPTPGYRRPVQEAGSRPQKPVGYAERQALAEEACHHPQRLAPQPYIRQEDYRGAAVPPVRHATAQVSPVVQPGGNARTGAVPPMRETHYRTEPLPASARGQISTHTTNRMPLPEETSEAWRGYSITSTQPHPPQDPFDEPGEDPSLVIDRSDKLYNREDPFWQHPEGALAADKPVKPAQGSHVLRNLLLIVLVLLAAGLVLRGTVFRIRSITVVGNETMTAEEIIRIAGIREGASILELDAEDVAMRISSNRYLIFDKVETELPNSVILTVKERIPTAAMSYCGVNYTLDSQGMVLEDNEAADEEYDGLTEIRGFTVTDCITGRKLGVSKAAQLTIFNEYMTEIHVLSLKGEIRELNLSDVDNIYLVTIHGFSARMGDGGDAHAKLRALCLTQDKLMEMGYDSGTIDVSNPVNPAFIPEDGTD